MKVRIRSFLNQLAELLSMPLTLPFSRIFGLWIGIHQLLETDKNVETLVKTMNSPEPLRESSWSLLLCPFLDGEDFEYRALANRTLQRRGLSPRRIRFLRFLASVGFFVTLFDEWRRFGDDDLFARWKISLISDALVSGAALVLVSPFVGAVCFLAWTVEASIFLYLFNITRSQLTRATN